MDASRQIGRKVLDHEPPFWIDPDASDFFITICCQRRGNNQLCLSSVSTALLDSARFYHQQRKWFPALFLLMPDHLRMIVSFGREHRIAKVVGAWKSYASRQHGLDWQKNFFEHRLRRDESREAEWPHWFALDERSGQEHRRATSQSYGPPGGWSLP